MITYSNSFIEFIKNSDCKIAQILFRLHKKRYEPLMVNNLEVDYLTFRTDGTISFLPAGKEHKTNEDTGDWLRDGRQNGKPGKVIRKLFCDKAQKWFKDADFECFANSYKANFNEGGYKFELLSNSNIPDVYEMDRADGEGSLNNSCMNGDSSYLDIYKYCKQLSILTLKNTDDLLCGRALIWKIGDITLMDRIYVTQDFMYDKFLMYAKQAKYWRKKDYKSYDNKQTFVDTEGNEVERQFTINTNCEHSEYPYIDTFQYGDDSSLNNYGAGDYTYNNTDGTRDGDEDNHNGETYDDINGDWISEEDAIYIECGERQYRDRYCHIDNCVCVNDSWYYEDDNTIVEVNGTWYEKDSIDITEIDGEFYHIDDDDICFVESDGEYHLTEDCVYSKEHSEYILKDDAVEVCGNYFKKDDVKELA